MNKWTCQLSAHEMQIAHYLGKLRCETAKDDDSTDDTGIKKSYNEREKQNIIACIGELAVSKMLNVYWSAMAWMQPDVGGYIEVRSIVEDWQNLIVRFPDKDKSPMVLVLVQENVCTAKGWDFVENIRKEGVFSNDKGVPYWRTTKAHKFKDMDELLLRHLNYQKRLNKFD